MGKRIVKMEYQKKYRQLPEAKEKNKKRMAEVYATKEGQEYELYKRRTLRSRYTRGKYNAERRNKDFSLTYEDYCILMDNNCKYCNGGLEDETGIGLDRIDNDIGYVLGNVNPCCKTCNRIRAKSMSATEFEKQTTLNKRRKVK